MFCRNGCRGEQPQQKNFPIRNRIISGLSDVIPCNGGQTEERISYYRKELDWNREKNFALPGRISDPLSEGCNRLIQEGAGVLLSPEDVLEYFTLRKVKY